MKWAAAVLCVLCVVAGARSDDRAVIQLNDENFDHVVNDFEVVLVNFYADWCRFSKMLEPALEQAAKLLGDSVDARIARLDCEDPKAQMKKQANMITKYPTIKVFRNGKPLRTEYRGQRSGVAIESYVRELVADPILPAKSEDDVKTHLDRHRKAMVGHFSSEDHVHLPLFRSLAKSLRDDCHFIAYIGSNEAGENGAKIEYRTTADRHPFEGNLVDAELLKHWASSECTPLVREITFENGEELTEEGIPFIILFYDPADLHPVQQFSRVVRAHCERYRGFVNFILADGNKFSHPLQHVGKSKKDLPVLAADTFRHMYLFKNFKRIHRVETFHKFIDDVVSGRLHQELHNPQLRRANADPYDEMYDEYDDEPEPDTALARKETLKEKLEDAEDLKRESKEAAKVIKEAETASKAMADKFMALKKERSDDAAARGEDAPADGEGDDEDDEVHHVPVPVKSVLNRLKPSENRYTLINNRDEL